MAMHLTSAIDPAGPKSTKHYLVLHFNNRRKLIKLPESYSDLEKQAKRLYHIDPGSFHVETEDLNVCKGHHVEVPEEDWEDISQLLGTVHIVPNTAEDRPEPSPEADKQTETTAVSTADQGVVTLKTPFVKEEVLAISIGDIDFGANTTSSIKFSVQLLDESENSVISIS